MSKQPNIVGQIEHASSGLTLHVALNGTTRFSTGLYGLEFKANSREKLERLVSAALDQLLALDWTPTIEARARVAAADESLYNLSIDRFWTLQLPGGDLLRANWRVDDDDNRRRLMRAYTANLPEEFGTLPLVHKTPGWQRVFMAYTDATWASLEQTIARMKWQAQQSEPAATLSAAQLTVFIPQCVMRYELDQATLEGLIREHLEIDYAILDGEQWPPDSDRRLSISLDGYDDSDRAVIEQVRGGERAYFALEMLMRVLAEKHVIPEGEYLITAH